MSLLRYTPPFFFWLLGGAVLASYYGPLSVLNPFRHLLSMVEAMRYLVGTLVGSGVSYTLVPVETVNSIDAIAGLFGLVGWAALFVVIMVRYGATEI